MDNKRVDMSHQKQDSKHTDTGLKEFVDEISGQDNREQYQDTLNNNKSRIADEQNRMIDKHNLRK
ncbi:MAG: hypothetical protein H7X86_13565 [Gorillibacterium sp.]|nr:hypothetical protein [Gorillibacterium sp.]